MNKSMLLFGTNLQGQDYILDPNLKDSRVLDFIRSCMCYKVFYTALKYRLA